MRNFRRLIACLCVFVLSVGSLGLYPISAEDGSMVEVGDYMYLGEYNGEPILWRCVMLREEGPLMMSDKIITYKAFDADSDGDIPEDPDNLEQIRACYGSNDYSTSSLRQWLNTEGEVKWEGHIPYDEHVTRNPYAGENGFISSFTKDELALVKEVRNASIISVHDKAKADSGKVEHSFSLDYRITSMIANYDESFIKYTNDRFFLPSIKELVETNKNLPGSYEVAYPTPEAALECDDFYMDEVGATYYWLRDAFAHTVYPEAVRCMFPGQHIYFAVAHNGNIGVRPAFVLENTEFKFGDGTKNAPYALIEGLKVNTEPLERPDRNEVKREYIGSTGISSTRGAGESIAIGDYIEMGELDGAPILWRCIDIDENGPLMLSDRILRFYAFDAIGERERDVDNKRATYGSNQWSLSTLRHWLNSDLNGWGNWEGVKIPAAANVYNKYSPYNTVPGFLTSFSPEEREMMKTVEISSILNELDVEVADTGTQLDNSRRKPNLIGDNELAYKETTEDTVFLMDRVQVNNLYSLFEDYLLATPTIGAITQSDYKTYAIGTGKTWHYWLRDAYGSDEYPYYVMDVTTDGRISSDISYRAQYGVRPAFYIDLDTAHYEQGSGSKSDPHRIKRHSFSDEIVVKELRCETNGVSKIVCETCGQEHEYTTVATGHDFKVKITPASLFFTEIETGVCTKCGINYSVGGTVSSLGVVMISGAAVLLLLILVIIIIIRRRMNAENDFE